MKISELAPGRICCIAGMDLELEVLEHTLCGTRVRPTEVSEVTFAVRRGAEARILVRPSHFTISLETEVAEVS